MPRPIIFTRLVTRDVVQMPDQLENGVLYVSREFELAIHLCACGCGGEGVTPFHDGGSGWTLTPGPHGMTLHPSIGHQHWPCGSHYWIRDGEVTQA